MLSMVRPLWDIPGCVKSISCLLLFLSYTLQALFHTTPILVCCLYPREAQYLDLLWLLFHCPVSVYHLRTMWNPNDREVNAKRKALHHIATIRRPWPFIPGAATTDSHTGSEDSLVFLLPTSTASSLAFAPQQLGGMHTGVTLKQQTNRLM